MLHFRNLTILGTSHIAASSIRQLEREFSRLPPDIVAIELDRSRLEALLRNEKPNYSPRLIFQIGVSGYLFALIGGALQKKLGNLVGVTPGSEMMRAATLTKEHQKKLALIDQDVRLTLKRLSQEFTFKEKMRLLIDVLLSPFSKKIQINLKDVPERQVINELIKLLKERYPGLYNSLIGERNHHMASRLVGIMRAFPEARILAVVGAGHEEELAKIIEKSIRSSENPKHI